MGRAWCTRPLHTDDFWRCQLAHRAVGKAESARLPLTAGSPPWCWFGALRTQTTSVRGAVRGSCWPSRPCGRGTARRRVATTNLNCQLRHGAAASLEGAQPVPHLHEQATGRGGGGGQPGCPVYERRRAVQGRRCGAPLRQTCPRSEAFAILLESSSRFYSNIILPGLRSFAPVGVIRFIWTGGMGGLVG